MVEYTEDDFNSFKRSLSEVQNVNYLIDFLGLYDKEYGNAECESDLEKTLVTLENDNSDNWQYKSLLPTLKSELSGKKTTLSEAVDFLKQHVKRERVSELQAVCAPLIGNPDFQKLMQTLDNPVHAGKTNITDLMQAWQEAQTKQQETVVVQAQAAALERTNQIRELANKAPEQSRNQIITQLSNREGTVFDQYMITIAEFGLGGPDFKREDFNTQFGLTITCKEFAEVLQSLQQGQSQGASASAW